MAVVDTCQQKIVYIYNLPFFEKAELCKILDHNGKWEELAGIWMKYDDLTIQNLRKEKHPTDKLLDLWGHHNHTILELFILLRQMQHYQSMIPLKRFVDPKYHILINNDKDNRGKLLDRRRAGGDTKDLKIGSQNFNQAKPAPAEVQKVLLHESIHERVAKILNRSPQPNIDQEPSNSDNMLVPTGVNQKLSPVLRPVAESSKNNNQTKVSSIETSLPQIPYEELARATSDWSKHTILGKGGFGTVFRGMWKNTQVAIKKIEQRGPASNESYLIQLEQSLRELKILNAYRHDNILSLYAYSMGGEAPCLVYQFMPNGSLEDRLSARQGNRPLTWLQRHEIARGTARGLQFLHTIGNKPLIHGDIKSANILLDKNFEPRIGDFGLAREGPENDYMKVSRVQGTRPYLPDEFLRGRNLSTKIDTYSYGIVLLELATGLAAYNDSRPEHKFLKSFIDSWEEKNLHSLKDRRAGTENEQVFHNLMVLGKWCSNQLSMDRPEMVSVLRKLDEL